MKLKYFGNAMILLQGKHSSVLSDPWVTFNRVSKSGLYTFPELKMSREDVAAIKPDFLYISHTHADHYDPITLSLFPRSTPVLVADYENNFTARHMREIGFTDVRIIDREKGAPLNGDDHCWLEPNAIYPDVDSLIVTKIDGMITVNMNDNPYDRSQCEAIVSRFGKIDLACVPFCFQGPYPAFYENLSEEERQREAVAKKIRNFDILVNFADTLKPEYLFPFAAGAIYGGAKARMFPYFGVGGCSEALDHAAKKLGPKANFKPLLLSQLCSYDFASGTKVGTAQEVGYSDELEYIEDIANRSGPFEAGGDFFIAENYRIDLEKLLLKARIRQKEWQDRRKIVSDAVYFLDVGEKELYRLSLGDLTVSRVEESGITDEAYEIFRLPYSLMIGLLTGHFNWSNVKTQYVSFYRKPNVFHADLHILMSFLQV